MSVVVLIPWRGGCPHRERALAHITARLGYTWHLAPCPPEGPWIKALGLMPAVERSEAEIVVVHDADVECDGLSDAVHAVEGGAPWAIPHLKVHRLTEDGAGLERPAYRGIEGGGIIVARRETLLDVPLDPRFIGWGQEDESWSVALRTLAGAPWRGTADLIHHYHPAQPRLSRARGSQEGWNLRRRYMRARRNPDEMRRIVEEARVHLADKPTLHAHSPV